MNKDLETLFLNIKNDFSSFINLKLKIFQLDFSEKLGKLSSLFFIGLILILLLFFFVLFLGISLGLYLGELFNSYGLGMICVALLYLVAMFVIILNKQALQTKMVNLFIEELINDNEDEDQQ
ncbi:hypothetical protein AwDysgo_02140 [Bacteroidales bacterium]|nr:hypothetical protein AwDysgo_02140 [Bacteroidales bacterium]